MSADMFPEFEILPLDPRDHCVDRLLEDNRILHRDLSGGHDGFAPSAEDLSQPNVTFFAARHQDGYVACGALARMEGYGEVKAMYVEPDARGTGVAIQILDRIEAEARQAGLTILRLETSSELDAALWLYTKAGFLPRPPFGGYTKNPASIFMEKGLS